MFAKLFIVALAVAAVVARPGLSTVYSSPVVSAVGPAVVAARSPYVTSTYHGVASPISYSSYAAPAAVSAYSAYSAPVASYAYGSPVTTYAAGAPVAYSTYGAAPYATYY